MDKLKCPACGAANPTNNHLIWEWTDLQKGVFNRMFGHNARNVQEQVGDMLLARGITHIPNMFGDIPIRRKS